MHKVLCGTAKNYKTNNSTGIVCEKNNHISQTENKQA